MGPRARCKMCNIGNAPFFPINKSVPENPGRLIAA